MNDDLATFSSFFAIPRAEVDADKETALSDREAILERVKRAGHSDRRAPADVARRHHQNLSLAHVVSQNPSVPEEEKLYLAAAPAWQIAELAAAIAHGKDSLAALSEAMREIELREGLRDGEYYPLGTGPDDYQQLQSQSEVLFDRVEATVFTTVLRRYGFYSLARMFEEDRATYELMREVGRRLLFKRGPSDEHDRAAQERLREAYGAAAHNELRRRLQSHGLL